MSRPGFAAVAAAAAVSCAGDRTIDVSASLDYFASLKARLDERNKGAGVWVVALVNR